MSITECVDSPTWYQGRVETIDKIEAVVEGLPAKQAYLLGQIIRYCDRAVVTVTCAAMCLWLSGKLDEIETED